MPEPEMYVAARPCLVGSRPNHPRAAPVIITISNQYTERSFPGMPKGVPNPADMYGIYSQALGFRGVHRQGRRAAPRGVRPGQLRRHRAGARARATLARCAGEKPAAAHAPLPGREGPAQQQDRGTRRVPPAHGPAERSWAGSPRPTSPTTRSCGRCFSRATREAPRGRWRSGSAAGNSGRCRGWRRCIPPKRRSAMRPLVRPRNCRRNARSPKSSERTTAAAFPA
jgi:hypothetical protein